MSAKSQKINYLLQSATRYFSTKTCPYCGSTSVKTIDRKYLVTRLLECNNCHLYFRHPVDAIADSEAFYQDDYQQEGGFTTDLPDEEALAQLLQSSFGNTEKSTSVFEKLFEALFPSGLKGIKMIDYGASWGYMSHQFKAAGIEVDPYEISVPRARFGKEKLGINIKTSEDELTEGNDIFFSSHVIEHHPDIEAMIALSRQKLGPNGLFIAECPNGSVDFRARKPESFHRTWGQIHPNMLNATFYQGVFAEHPYLITSPPYLMDEIGAWDQKSQQVADTSGDNLMVIAKVNQSIQ